MYPVSHFEPVASQVITAFIHSRMELVRALQSRSDAGAELDDPLDNEEQLTEQLDTLPSLCRFQLQQVARPEPQCAKRAKAYHPLHTANAQLDILLLRWFALSNHAALTT